MSQNNRKVKQPVDWGWKQTGPCLAWRQRLLAEGLFTKGEITMYVRTYVVQIRVLSYVKLVLCCC